MYYWGPYLIKKMKRLIRDMLISFLLVRVNRGAALPSCHCAHRVAHLNELMERCVSPAGTPLPSSASPSPFSSGFFHMLVHFFTAGQHAVFSSYSVATVIRTLKSALTLLSILYLCFLFAFLFFLMAIQTIFFFVLVFFCWSCHGDVYCGSSVLQWCFKPIQSYQEKAIRCWYAPISLELLLPETSLFFFCPLSGSAYLELFSLFFFLSFPLVWREKGWPKKKDRRNEKKKWGGWRATEAVEGEQCRAAVPVSEFGFRRSRAWKSIFLKLKHEWNVQWRPVDNGAFMLPSRQRQPLLLCSTGNFLSFLFWGSGALDRGTRVCVYVCVTSKRLMEEGGGGGSRRRWKRIVGGGGSGGFSTWTCSAQGIRTSAAFTFVRTLSQKCSLDTSERLHSSPLSPSRGSLQCLALITVCSSA